MAVNVNDWFSDALWALRAEGVKQDSRNGRVIAIERPMLFTVARPEERVLFNPKRMANPYLHVMETVWMLAGDNEVDFLLTFSKQMEAYANGGVINGAYGHRWRNHFGRDQIKGVVKELTEDLNSRQAVIGMYDPAVDHHRHWNDRPCNTHIYFRADGGELDMTVCNRSNDVVWGMCGANAVHMTYLQELVARALGMEVGFYNVMTNNLHIYEHHWHLLEGPGSYNLYGPKVKPYPILHEGEEVRDLLIDCENFVQHQEDWYYRTKWMKDVVLPMHGHYMCRLNGDKDTYDINENKATDWRTAEELWRSWNA